VADTFVPGSSPKGYPSCRKTESLVDPVRTEFGWIEVGGTRYEYDIVIHTDRSITKRKKRLSKPFRGQYGHTPLSAGELEFLAEEKPDIVYIGTGQYGDLPLTPEAREVLGRYPVRIGPTPEIIEEACAEKRKFAAVLHVTC